MSGRGSPAQLFRRRQGRGWPLRALPGEGRRGAEGRADKKAVQPKHEIAVHPVLAIHFSPNSVGGQGGKWRGREAIQHSHLQLFMCRGMRHDAWGTYDNSDPA